MVVGVGTGPSVDIVGSLVGVVTGTGDGSRVGSGASLGPPVGPSVAVGPNDADMDGAVVIFGANVGAFVAFCAQEV